MDVLLLVGAICFASSLPGQGRMTSVAATVPYATTGTIHSLWVLSGQGTVRLKTTTQTFCAQGFTDNQDTKAVKSELQNAKDDNFIDCRDNCSPTNSVARKNALNR
jgi:hypothetical protein